MSHQQDLRLDTVPGEILDGICDYLDKKDLKRVRLSTKRLSSIATTHLAKVYMTNLCSLMTRRSLEKLAEICAHPQFGPHVCKVHLTSGRVHPREIRALAERVEDMQRRIPPPTSAQVKRARAKMQDAMDRSTNEYELETSGDAVALLSRAFASLRTYQTRITLDISDFEVPRYDTITLFLDKYKHFHGEPELCFKSTIEPCIQAIVNTKMQFHELELSFDALPIDPAETGYDVTGMRPEDLDLFSGLKSVSLDLNNTFDDAATQSTAKILLHARSLEELSYRQGCIELNRENWVSPQQQPELLDTRRFEHADLVLKSVKSSGLKLLWIEYTPISYPVLVQLLKENADALTDISLAQISLRDGIWADIFSLIKETCRFVSQLNVEDLGQATPDVKEGQYRTLVLPEQCSPGTSFGRARVNEVLEQLVQAPSTLDLDILDRSTRVHNVDTNPTTLWLPEDEVDFDGEEAAF